MLLSIFTVIMDQVERSGLSGEDLAKFKVARRQDYNLLLVKESLVGENVCTETLSAVTEREVAAGRMAPDDELRTTAEVGMAAPHLTRAQLIGIEEERQRVKSPSSSWAQKLIRVFKK
jgi:hypothetical protein